MRRAFALDPSNVQLARDVGSSLNLLARMHLAAGRTTAAADASARSQRPDRTGGRGAPDNTDFISGAIHAREGEGDALLGQLAMKRLPRRSRRRPPVRAAA